MAETPEQEARRTIDAQLAAAGWAVQNLDQINLSAARGVAVREMQSQGGPADYVLFVDGKALGVLEAKKAGTTLSGVAEQSRTVIRTLREKLFTEIFPDRRARANAKGVDEPWVPKTLIFAQDDNRAEDIVDIIRKEFGKGNNFCKKVTYRASGKSEDIIKAFRTAPEKRIAVTDRNKVA